MICTVCHSFAAKRRSAAAASASASAAAWTRAPLRGRRRQFGARRRRLGEPGHQILAAAESPGRHADHRTRTRSQFGAADFLPLRIQHHVVGRHVALGQRDEDALHALWQSSPRAAARPLCRRRVQRNEV